MSPHNIFNILYRAHDSKYVPSGFIVTQCASYLLVFLGGACYVLKALDITTALCCVPPYVCAPRFANESMQHQQRLGEMEAQLAHQEHLAIPCGENDDEPVDFGVLTQRLHHVLSCDSTSGKRTLCKMVSYRQLPYIWFHVDFQVSVCVRTSY